MELVEIVVQGLVGAMDLQRAPFQAGLTVLPAGTRERLYARLILDLLYPEGTEPTLFDLDQPGTQSRVGLTVQGRDGQRYRLLHDVHTGRRALQRLTGDKAENITNAAAEIAQAVTATLGFPQADILRELLFCVKEDLPSQRPARANASAAGGAAGAGGTAKIEKPLPPGFGGAEAPRRTDKPLPPGFSDEGAPVLEGGRTDAELRARLQELEGLLAAQGGVQNLEFELDGLQKKIFEVEARLKPIATLRRSVEQAEEGARQYEAVAQIPADIVEQGERLLQIRADKERDLDRLEESRQQLLEGASTLDKSGRLRPFEVAKSDPLVRYGAAAGVGAIVLGFVGAATSTALQWAALLDIPAFGVAVFGGIRVLSRLEAGESVRRRVQRVEDQQRKIEERFQIDEEHVRGLLERHGYTLQQLPDLADRLKARDEAAALVESTRAALAEVDQGADAALLQNELENLQARARAIEDELASSSVGFSSPSDLLAEKQELERRLRGEDPSGGHELSPAEPAPMADPFQGMLPVATAADDDAQRLLELARDVLLGSIEDIAAQVQGRASQILKALADGRYAEVRFGGRGETSVVDAAAGQPIAFGLLPPFDRDVVWLSLKVALIELVVKRERIPVLFDRGLDALADTKGPILQKMLQFLSSSTQVVSISEKPALGGRPG
jgi:hypothetical protein